MSSRDYEIEILDTAEDIEDTEEPETPEDDFDMVDIWNLDYIAKGGADTIYLSLKVKWRKDHEQIRSHLEHLRDTSKNGSAEDDFFPELSIQGHNWYVMPYGMNTGDSKFSYYPLLLKECGIRYLLADRDFEETTASGNLTVMIGSLPLMKWGDEICYKIIMSAIRTMGGKVKECKISRLDLCVDLPGISCAAFQQAINDDRFVCRAKKVSEYVIDHNPDTETKIVKHRAGRKLTGVSIGKANIIARIYDKLEEVKHDEDKSVVLLNNRYDGVIPECASRVEVQLGRDALRNLEIIGKCESIRYWDDYIKFKGFIIEYLVTRWLRLYKHDVDRTHTSRLNDDDLLPEWKIVIEEFRKLGSGNADLVKSGDKRRKPEALKLKRQGLGCLFSAIANTDHYPRTKDEIIFTLYDLIEETTNLYSDEDLQNIMEKKAARHRSEAVNHLDVTPY